MFDMPLIYKERQVSTVCLVEWYEVSMPEELKGLNALEFRMLAARLPFMKIYAAAQGGQYKVRGNVVNVIADTASTISSLPRLPDDTCTIRVQLKSHLKYKNYVMSQNMRPETIIRTAKYLCTKAPLYVEYGIVYDPTWSMKDSDHCPPDNADETAGIPDADSSQIEPKLSEGKDRVHSKCDNTQE